jgi:putative membrane protein
MLASLLSAAWLYGRGVWRLWRDTVGRGVRRWEVSAYVTGWLCLWLALVSPLHPLGQVLFCAHMAQHEVLMLAAAPLLVCGRPLFVTLWALPRPWRRVVGDWSANARVRRAWQVLTVPLAAWLLHAGALWVWHAPALFQATLQSELIHTFQHLSFFGSAALFWWALLRGRGGWMGYGGATLYVFTTSIHSGALGAVLTFSTTLWYPRYQLTAAAWGLSPLEDQQLGGLLMWVPAGVLYLVIGLWLSAGWLSAAERRADRLPLAPHCPDNAQ